MDTNRVIEILTSEIERTTGCTDPVSICLAVSRATCELGTLPDKVVVTVSPNLYKNAINVGIPGTEVRGMLWAAALGAVIDNSEAGLALLDAIDEDKMSAAQVLIDQARVHVGYDESISDALYIYAQVFAGQDRATTTVRHDYSHIIEVTHNDTTVFHLDAQDAIAHRDDVTHRPVREWIDLIQTIAPTDLAFLVEAAQINKEAALEGLRDKHMRLGPALSHSTAATSPALILATAAQTMTAAASEARMRGLKVPVMAVTGSGNQGITDLLGVLSVAEGLDVDEDTLAHALAISTLITIYVKSLTRRLTSFCGAAVAAATGVAAATVYMLGGSYLDMEHAMQSVVGTFAGMLCDGAKESCAYKIGAAIPAAVQFAHLALEGAFIPAGDGIVGNTIEETFHILGHLDSPAMTETDAFMLQTIQEIQETRPHANGV